MYSFVSFDSSSLHKQKSQVGEATTTIFIAVHFANRSVYLSSKLKNIYINSFRVIERELWQSCRVEKEKLV